MAPKGHRSYKSGKWHFCSRCATRYHIANLRWQRGLLLCIDCYDRGNDGFPLIGERELAVVRAFEMPSLELLPDPKLTDTVAIDASMNEDLIY